MHDVQNHKFSNPWKKQIQMKTQKQEIIHDKTLTLTLSTIQNAAQDPFA